MRIMLYDTYTQNQPDCSYLKTWPWLLSLNCSVTCSLLLSLSPPTSLVFLSYLIFVCCWVFCFWFVLRTGFDWWNARWSQSDSIIQLYIRLVSLVTLFCRFCSEFTSFSLRCCVWLVGLTWRQLFRLFRRNIVCRVVTGWSCSWSPEPSVISRWACVHFTATHTLCLPHCDNNYVFMCRI